MAERVNDDEDRRERCDVCDEPSPVGFNVPDATWLLVTEQLRGDEPKPDILCLGCFTWFADRLRIQWDSEIEFHPVSLVTSLT